MQTFSSSPGNGVLQRPYPLAALLLALTAAILWPGLGGIFLFDDYVNILNNDTLRIGELSVAALQRAAFSYDATGFGRPLAMLSFAFDFWLWGHDTWGFKLTSLLLHLVNALLVFILARKILALEHAAPQWPALAAFFVAAVWALHPLQVSSVFYVVQRMEVLSVSFLLLGLIVYIAARQSQIAGRPGLLLLGFSGLLAGIGLLSKEVALLFPVFALGLELTVLGFAAHSPQVSRVLRWTYALGCLLAIVAFVFIVFPHYANDQAYALREFSWEQRLLTQLRVLPTYLGWIVLPRPAQFVFYYDHLQVSQGLLQPATTLWGGVLLAMLFTTALALRRRLPLFSLGVLWFFGAHLISSNVVPLELAFEHRNYFAILGVVLAGAGLLSRMALQPRAILAVACVLLLGCSALSLLRATVWGDPLHHLTETRDRNPTSMRASADLAEHYMRLANYSAESKLYALGMDELRRAAALPGHSLLPEQGLILMAGAAGQPIEDAWWQRILEKLATAPAVAPQDISVITGFLNAMEQGVAIDHRRLAQAYSLMVARVGVPAWQVFVYGDHALNKLGDTELAFQLFQEAIRRAPEKDVFALDLLVGLNDAGQTEMAHRVLAFAVAEGLVARDQVSLLNESQPDQDSEGNSDKVDAPIPPEAD